MRDTHWINEATVINPAKDEKFLVQFLIGVILAILFAAIPTIIIFGVAR